MRMLFFWLQITSPLVVIACTYAYTGDATVALGISAFMMAMDPDKAKRLR